MHVYIGPEKPQWGVANHVYIFYFLHTSKAGYKIARNTGLKYLTLRITQCHQHMHNLQVKIQELMQNLEDHLSREDMLGLQNVVQHTSEKTSERLADTHTRKINDLISKQS